MDFIKRHMFMTMLIFVIVFITGFNVYMLLNMDSLNSEKIKELESELLLEQKNADDKVEETSETSVEKLKLTRELDETKIVNSTKRFFEFIYDNEKDNYVIRKKDASNYMNDEMIERFFPSDNVVENGVKVKLFDIEVYTKKDDTAGLDDNKKALVSYKLDVSLKENMYSEPMKVYMEVTLEEDNDAYKVVDVEEFGNEGSMIYE